MNNSDFQILALRWLRIISLQLSMLIVASAFIIGGDTAGNVMLILASIFWLSWFIFRTASYSRRRPQAEQVMDVNRP